MAAMLPRRRRSQWHSIDLSTGRAAIATWPFLERLSSQSGGNRGSLSASSSVHSVITTIFFSASAVAGKVERAPSSSSSNDLVTVGGHTDHHHHPHPLCPPLIHQFILEQKKAAVSTDGGRWPAQPIEEAAAVPVAPAVGCRECLTKPTEH